MCEHQSAEKAVDLDPLATQKVSQAINSYFILIRTVIYVNTMYIKNSRTRVIQNVIIGLF